MISGCATAAICTAAQAGLISTTATVLPSQICIMAQLAQESWVGFVQVREDWCLAQFLLIQCADLWCKNV